MYILYCSVVLTVVTSDCGSFQYQFNSLGSIQSCCHHSAGNYSNTQVITVNQIAIHSGVERLHIQVKCLTQEHSANRGSWDPCPSLQDLSILSHRPQSLSRGALQVHGVYILDVETLEPGACHPQWFFYVPLNVHETAPPFTWSCEPWGIHSLRCWRVRNNSPQASPVRDRD